MSNSKKKKNTSASRVRQSAQQRKARKNVAKNSTILLVVTAIALFAVFIGRWYISIGRGYFSGFVVIDANTPSAVATMKGLKQTDAEKEMLLPLQKQWDLWSSSRLRDEVTITAEDGAELHAYYYDEGGDVTVVVLPRFYGDGTADFLPGPYLNELTGCNLLLPDPRQTGGSTGGYFTYGVKEKEDVAAWLAWAEERFGPQTFILWGEGTGANTLLFAEADGLLPGNVAFIVAESPYASLREVAVDRIWSWYGVPTPFLGAVEGRLNRSGAGFRVDDVNVVKARENADPAPTTPILFLSSSADAYVEPAWTQAVIEAWDAPTTTAVVGSGSHGTVYAEKQAELETLLASWWASYR